MRALNSVAVAIAGVVAVASDVSAGPIGVNGFLENRGQWSADLRYRSWVGAEAVYVERNALTVEHVVRGADSTRASVVRLAMEVEPKHEPRGEHQLPGRHNFFIGPDPTEWVCGVAWYESVVYREVVPGVDLRVRFAEAGHFEYDLLIEPGGHIEDLVFRCEGADRMWINSDGDLLIEVGDDLLRQPCPRTWIVQADGSGILIGAGFRQIDKRRFGFWVETPADARVLLDPGLVWSTYFGGVVAPVNGGLLVNDIHVDHEGIVTFGGRLSLSDLPTTTGAYLTSQTSSGSLNGFAIRMNSSGNELVFGTYIGSAAPGFEHVASIDVAAGGDTLLLGSTGAQAGFPITPGAYSTSINGDFSDSVFVTRLNAAGSALVFSSVFGGTKTEYARGIDVDEVWGVTVVGETASTNFPTTTGAYQTQKPGPLGASSCFVTRLTPDGSALVYSTYFGGSSFEALFLNGIAVDKDGSVAFAGRTFSADFPVTPGAYLTTAQTPTPGFLVKLNGSGSALDFATYLSSTAPSTRPHTTMIHPLGWITVFGEGGPMPQTPGTIQSFTGADDLFVQHFSKDGKTLVHGLAIGTPNSECAGGMAIDAAGNIVICGTVNNNTYPATAGAYDLTQKGGLTMVMSRIDPTLSKLEYSTYLGGNGAQGGAVTGGNTTHVGVQANGDVTVIGPTDAFDFPITPGAFMTQSTYPATVPTFLTRFDMLPTGVERFGTPAAGCDGIPAIGVNRQPKPGPDFTMSCTRVPTGNMALIGLSASLLADPLKVAGIDFWLNPQAFLLFPVPADSLGVARVSSFVSPHFIGSSVGAQFFVADTCASGGVAASAAIRITVQM